MAMRMQFFQEFIDVVDELSLTAAAKKNNISKSALSKHLAALEAYLGVELLDRQTTPLQLTPKGRTLYEGIRPIIEEYDALIQKLASTPYGKIKKLSLGVHNPAPQLLNDIMVLRSRLFKEYGTELFIHIVYTPFREKDFADYDLAITYEGGVLHPERYTITDVYHEPLVAIVPMDHPVAKQETFSMERDAKKWKFVMLQSDFFTTGRNELKRTLKEKGFEKLAYSYYFSANTQELISMPAFEGILLGLRRTLKYADEDIPQLVCVPLEEDLYFKTVIVNKPSRQDDPSIHFVVDSLAALQASRG